MAEGRDKPGITLDLTGYLTGWNAAAERLFGYRAEEAIGQHVLFLYPEGDEDTDIAEIGLDPNGAPPTVRRRHKNGDLLWLGMEVRLIEDRGAPIGLSVHFLPIEDRLSPEDKLRLHSRIIEESDQGIMIVDADERIVSVNAAFTRITGYGAMEAIGQTPDLLRSGVHDANFRAEVRAAMHRAGPWQGEIIGRRKSGELFPQSVTISVVRNERGEITHAFSIFSDISLRKEAEASLHRLANYDAVTNLPNRSLFNQLVNQALTVARRNKDHGALLVIELARFSAINDTLGHDVGDELLVRISKLFRATLREEDVLAKLDVDKFVVALLHIEKREHAAIVAGKLLEALARPIIVDAHGLHVEAHIGIAIYPDDGKDTATLVRFADVAMTRVQQSESGGYLFYSPEMNQRAKEHLRMEHDLRGAMGNGNLQLHYQPKVSLRSGQIVGAEALIRWNDPERGAVSPGAFIPVAEQTGLILDLGAWILDEACRQLREWQDAGLSMPPVAINLSGRQFDRNLPLRIEAVLDRHGIGPDRLKLEITESLLVRGEDEVIPTMNRLVAMGIGLALDDFGTGYSSLSYLKKFPISTLKIDRSFVIGLPKEENDCAIARAIVTMAQQLRHEIVAEGVETHEQMAFLRELGCDQLQGWLFSPALPAAKLVAMVEADQRLAL
ncbi:MAG TPA: EAL domain-containing protein [Arenimonas sp.]|nr:EAL domain-containing protein [Arenimonas sp.]